MMTTPPSRLLYTYRRCPYAMRARMALLVARLPFDAHEVVLRNKPAAMLAASPKGTVPVLVLDNGQILEQSWDIVQWALGHDPDNLDVYGWWTRAHTPDNLALLHINDGPFKQHLDRYKYPERFAEHDSPSACALDPRTYQREQAVSVLLGLLEHRLADQPFLGGKQPCAADFGIFPFVRQFAAVDPPWFNALHLPHVQNWLAYWLQAPLFAACMQKLPSDTRAPFPMQT